MTKGVHLRLKHNKTEKDVQIIVFIDPAFSKLKTAFKPTGEEAAKFNCLKNGGRLKIRNKGLTKLLA